MNQQIAPIATLRNQVMNAETAEQFRMALPAHISVEKFQRTVVTACSKNNDLLAADRTSLLNSCVSVSFSWSKASKPVEYSEIFIWLAADTLLYPSIL